MEPQLSTWEQIDDEEWQADDDEEDRPLTCTEDDGVGSRILLFNPPPTPLRTPPPLPELILNPPSWDWGQWRTLVRLSVFLTPQFSYLHVRV